MASNRSDSGASPGKIFIGGLSKDTVIDTFVKYFAKYGDITDSVVMKDRMTGRPRGFGFITYADPAVVDVVIAETHVIDGKQVEIKRTTPKGSSESKDIKTKKIFVGGIPTVLTEDEFKDFFSKYGNVTEHEIIRDHETNRSRGFGFISFESEQTVDEVLTNGNRIDLNGTQVEIKKAEPKKPSNPGPLSHIRESRGRGRGYGGSYDGFDDSYGGYDGGYDGGNGGGYGGGSGYGPPPPFRSYRGLPSRFNDYDPYGPSAREYGSRYSEYAGDYGSYRGGEPPVGDYPSRFSSYGSGGYDGGYGGRGLGGYGRGVGGGYGGFGGPGGDGGYESGAGAGAGVGSGSGLDYGGAGGPYRAGYSGASRYNPYGR